MTTDFENWQVVHLYTRKQAISDGVLIDITPQAMASGFRMPVAITQTVWGRWVEATEELQEFGQSTEARLRDVLAVLFFSIRKMPKDADTSRIQFKVDFLVDGDSNTYETPDLIAVCGPDDDGSPCITIMVPEDE